MKSVTYGHTDTLTHGHTDNEKLSDRCAKNCTLYVVLRAYLSAHVRNSNHGAQSPLKRRLAPRKIRSDSFLKFIISCDVSIQVT